MENVFEKALTSVVRREIMQNKQVTIEGLGTFRMEHKKQATTRGNDGKSVINPPQDIIIFTPEKESI